MWTFIFDEWKSILPEICQNLILGMHNCLCSCLASGGGYVDQTIKDTKLVMYIGVLSSEKMVQPHNKRFAGRAVLRTGKILVG